MNRNTKTTKNRMWTQVLRKDESSSAQTDDEQTLLTLTHEILKVNVKHKYNISTAVQKYKL
jgi:hypothetical protein